MKESCLGLSLLGEDSIEETFLEILKNILEKLPFGIPLGEHF